LCVGAEQGKYETHWKLGSVTNIANQQVKSPKNEGTPDGREEKTVRKGEEKKKRAATRARKSGGEKTSHREVEDKTERKNGGVKKVRSEEGAVGVDDVL